MQRLLYPLIFLLSVLPDADKHLKHMNNVANATQDSLKSIKNGIDSFQSSMVQFNQAASKLGGQTKVTPAAPQGSDSGTTADTTPHHDAGVEGDI